MEGARTVSLQALLRSLADAESRGPFSRDINAPTFEAWHPSVPVPEGQAVTGAVFGSYRPGRGRISARALTEPAVLRYTDQAILISPEVTPKPFDPVTRAADLLRRRAGLQPMAVPRELVTETPTEVRLPASHGGGVIRKRPDVPLNTPSQGSAQDQIKALRALFRP
jgi:hypothetical protein